jgi:hypothetical protein
VPVVTDNYAAAPDGTITATRLQFALNGGTTTADQSRILQPLAGLTGIYYTHSFWAKTNDGTTKVLQLRDDFAQTVAQLVTITGTWQRFVGVGGPAGNVTVNSIALWLRGLQGTSDSADILLWHPQTERTHVQPSGPMAYQRVGLTATDYDPIGFPKGAKFNGTNSWMSVAGLDLSASNKVGVAVSLRKDSDSTTGMALEFGVNTATVDGTFGIRASQSTAASYSWALRGTGPASGADAGRQVPSGYPAGHPGVLTCVFDLAGADILTQIVPQVNAVTPPNLAAMGLNAAGGGNFVNSTLYIGRRAGTSIPFNGVIQRITIRGGPATDWIELMRRWVNEPVRALT